MTLRPTRLARCLALAAALLLGACETSSLLPDDKLSVTNRADRFALEAFGLAGVTDDLRYFWPVTGTSVAIDVTSQITSGSVLLEVRDAGGAVVYSQQVGSAVDATVQGQSGVWQIDVSLTAVSGSFAFTAERVP